jgi:ferritin-like metal-binding protein YciE
MNTDTLADWLRDAHAMEKGTIDNIERLVGRLKAFPILADRYRTHLQESRRQLERLEQCLKELGTDASFLKDSGMKLAGIAQVYVTGPSSDEPVKHCLAAYGYENFEIASYISLIAAAEACGRPAIKQACEQSLQEERAMARVLEESIPEVTRRYLSDPKAAAAAE